MAREIQVMAWCDVDLAEDRRVPMVATHEVTLDGKAFTVDLCEDHELALYKPFAGMVTHLAAKVPKGGQAAVQGAGPGPRALAGVRATTPVKNRSDDYVRTCLLCSATLEGRNLHDRHLVQGHGLPKAMALYGDACPLCTSTFTTPQGLAIHGANLHNHWDLSALFWAAREAGDPHGLVAAALERVVALGGSVEPVAQVLSRAELDAQRDRDAQVVADAVNAAGLRKGQRGVTDVARDALGGPEAIPRARAADRVYRARELGLLAP